MSDLADCAPLLVILAEAVAEQRFDEALITAERLDRTLVTLLEQGRVSAADLHGVRAQIGEQVRVATRAQAAVGKRLSNHRRGRQQVAAYAALEQRRV
ncbi:MAG: hypothetical protein AAF918_09625 [Pseudomonadota bacterium]